MDIYTKGCFQALPDAVLIDMDNTLYAYDPAHQTAMDAVRKKACGMFSMSSETFDEIYSQARRSTKSRLEDTAASHSRLLYFQNMLEIIGLSSQMQHALNFEHLYWSTYLSSATLFSNAREALEDFHLHNIPVAIVTDLTAQIQFRKITYFGIDNSIDYIVTSEEAGQDKITGLPFRLALEKIRPRGNSIWMIGECATKDIAAARRHIGAITLQKLHEGVSPGTGEQSPDASFKHFEMLRKLIASLANKE